MTNRPIDVLIELRDKIECPACGVYLTDDEVDNHACIAGGECGMCGREYPPGEFLSHLSDCEGGK